MKKFLSILLAALMIAGLVPALLVGAAPKASAITEGDNGRIYHYYETFDDVDAVQGAAKVIHAMDWELPSDPAKKAAHESNLTATETGVDSTYMYEIKDGKLYVRNRGTTSEYVLIAGAEELGEVFSGAFVVEYTQTYLASSTSTDDGYLSLLYNANGALTSYGESALRISGWGDNRTSRAILDAGDVSDSVDRECAITDYNIHNDLNYTLYERLFGNIDAAPGTTNGKSLKGSKIMVDKEMRVRLEFDGVIGPRMYVNDILVSDPRNISNAVTREIAQKNYNDYLNFGGSYLALCVTPGIDCVVDEITVYQTRTATPVPSLFITEVATLPANAAAPYIELYNHGDSTLNLADYVAGYVVVDAAGNETVVTAPLVDYIGANFTVGNTEITAISANDARLKAGESVLLFPVDPTAPMTAAEFRAEYGLNAAQKVLPLSGEVFAVEPTEYRYWFVADRLDEKGRAYDWTQYSVKNMMASAAVESVVELIPSVAFGYDSDISESALMISTDPVAYHFGRGGDVQPGYSAHYIYGADQSVGVNTGMMVSRCVELISETKNVGGLLDVQKTYFDRISAFRKGLYNDVGGLAITEFIPVTAENDAYECFEITNIAQKPLNLYDFGMVSSGDAVYGGHVWTRGTPFEARPSADIANPHTSGAYMMKPGDVVVIWNKTAAAEGKTVTDFRAYHGLSANVDVVVMVCTDTAKNVVAANEGTVSYGIAAKADITRFLNGATATVAQAITDVLVPLHSLHYNVNGLYEYSWDDLMEMGRLDILSAMVQSEFNGCEMVGHILAAGTLLDGYFVRETDEYGNKIFRACEQGSRVQENDTTEYFAPKDKSIFFAYGSKQDLSFPADYAVSFSYGNSVYAGKGSGSLKRTMQVTRYDYDMAGRGYGILPYLVDVANTFVTTDIISGANADHTLGIVEDGQGVDISVKFPSYYTVTYLDSSAVAFANVSFHGGNCSDVYVVLTDKYDTWFVNGVKYQAGDAVIISGDTEISPVLTGTSDNTNDAGAGQDTAINTPGGTEDTTLAVDNMEPNSINESDAKGLEALVIALIVVVGCAVIAVGVVLTVKFSKKKNNA